MDFIKKKKKKNIIYGHFCLQNLYIFVGYYSAVDKIRYE